MKPPESDMVTGLAPALSNASTVYCATFPLPDTRQVFPASDSPRVASISSAKYTAP